MTPAHPRHPAITIEALMAELRRELAQRRRFYPQRVREGRMTQAEADHQTAAAAAWLADMERREEFHTRAHAAWERYKDTQGSEGPWVTTIAPAAHGLSWQARRAALTRELDLRARVYPRRVAEGAMTQATANHQRACLEALADIYDDGFDWRASNGEAPHHGSIRTTPEIDQARREWLTHWQTVEARRQPATQEAML